MIATKKLADQELESDLGESSGSHQQLVAVLVETQDLRVSPDPMLEKTDRDTLAELESILYSL